MVGERGPELVNLPRGAQVYPTNETQQMLGAGTVVHNTYVLNYQGVPANEGSVSDALRTLQLLVG